MKIVSSYYLSLRNFSLFFPFIYIICTFRFFSVLLFDYYFFLSILFSRLNRRISLPWRGHFLGPFRGEPCRFFYCLPRALAIGPAARRGREARASHFRLTSHRRRDNDAARRCPSLLRMHLCCCFSSAASLLLPRLTRTNSRRQGRLLRDACSDVVRSEISV